MLPELPTFIDGRTPAQPFKQSGALGVVVQDGDADRHVPAPDLGGHGAGVLELGQQLDPAAARGLGEHWVTRPFSPRVLVGAVGEALRSDGPGALPGELKAGPVVLEPRARTVTVGERPVALTVTEFDLLEFLMGNPGRVFTREQLLDAAWGPGAGAGSRTVDVHIAQLRAKLGEGSPIRTVRGVGYVLDA